MLLILPDELVCMIAKSCPLGGQASLTRCCRRLYGLCNYVLYRNDVHNYDSSSVFHAIAWCISQDMSLRTLWAAKKGGADFEVCRDARNHQPASSSLFESSLHSPIALAATRGLERIVAFLTQQGVSLDGWPNSSKPPLAEAIHFRHESTAMILVQGGASIFQRHFRFDAVVDTIIHGLTRLLQLIIDKFRLDVDVGPGYGLPMIMLAINHGQKEIIRQLLSSGADPRLALNHLSRNHEFPTLSWTLSAGIEGLTVSLQLGDILDLMTYILSQRPNPNQKSQHTEVLARLLELLRRVKYASCPGSSISNEELDDILDALLEAALSFDVANTDFAILTLQHGAKVRAGIFQKLLTTLDSGVFADDCIRCLRRYPKLLQTFDFVYNYCLSSLPNPSSFMIKRFLEKVPRNAVQLICDLKRQNLPFTAKGVQRLAPRGL